MELGYKFFIICFLIIILCSGCRLIDGEPLTTESIKKRLEKCYGEGEVEVQQMDSKNWEITLQRYPDIKYTVTEKIGPGSVVPVPQYKFTDNRMEKLGNLIAPKYFTADEMEKISYETGTIRIEWDIRNEEDIVALTAKFEEFCRDMRDNYSQIVDDTVVSVVFNEPAVVFSDSEKLKIAEWGDLDDKSMSAYLDAKYGEKSYIFIKPESEENDKEIEVVLIDYPEIRFHLLTSKSDVGSKKIISDTLYQDACEYAAWTFPKSDYDDSQSLAVEGLEKIAGDCLNGFFLRRYIEWKTEQEIISKMPALHQKLREYISKQALLIYADYPQNQNRVNPPIVMQLIIRL